MAEPRDHCRDALLQRLYPYIPAINTRRHTIGE